MLNRFALALAFAIAAPAYAGDRIEGAAVVVDGDTLRIEQHRIRLFGIDAPEKAQTCVAGSRWPCGQQATEHLRQLVAGGRVRCDVQDRDRYGRAVAICSAGGRDLSEAMARDGYAVATPQYSARYVPAEQLARAERRGLWAGKFQMPADYRRDMR